MRNITVSPKILAPILKISSFICFSAINAIVRYLSNVEHTVASYTPLPAYEVAFFQNFFGLLFLVPWIIKNGPKSLKTKEPLLQFIRVILSACGVVIWYESLHYLPIADAVGLMFLGPIITAIGAWFFLKEHIGRERSIAILLGIIGGSVISHSAISVSGLSLAAIMPVAAATCFSGATLLVRKISQKDSPELIVTYLLLFMAPILLIPTIMSGRIPELWEVPWLFAMGGLAAMAHLFLSKAYQVAEVSYLVPYGISKWFASAIIGCVAFAEIPTLWSTIGAITLMLSIILLSIIEGRKRKISA